MTNFLTEELSFQSLNSPEYKLVFDFGNSTGDKINSSIWQNGHMIINTDH